MEERKERGEEKDGGREIVKRKVQIHTLIKCGAKLYKKYIYIMHSCTFLTTCTYEHQLASVDDSSKGPLSALHRS